MFTRPILVFVAGLLLFTINSYSDEKIGVNPSPANLNRLLQFDASPTEIRKIFLEEKYSLLGTADKVAAQNPGEANFNNAILPLENSLRAFSDTVSLIYLIAYNHPDPAVAGTSNELIEESDKILTDIFSRSDLYNVLSTVQAKEKNLAEDEKFLLSEYLDGLKFGGAALPPEKVGRFKDITNEISKLSLDYQKALREDKKTVDFTKNELVGVNDEILSLFIKSEGADKYTVAVNEGTRFPLLENAVNAQTRQRYWKAYSQRGGGKNVDRLERILEIRDEAAKLLGYAHNADRKISGESARSHQVVLDFLNDLVTKIQPERDRNIAELLELKKKEVETKSEAELGTPRPDPTRLEAWDTSYYQAKLKEEKYKVDKNVIRKYFPLESVVKGMFEIYQTLFGITFEKINLAVWHPDVTSYAILDKDKVIAYFYADLFTRDEPKYTHAAQFGMVSGYQTEDGGYQQARGAIVSNFARPKPGKPSLLSHDEVETLFHEFGHVMHNCLTTVRFGTISGANTQRDFVEAPSQMLENWIWNKESLKKMSAHIETKEPLPDALLDSMISAKLSDSGIFYSRQLMLNLIDQTYHRNATVDTTAVWRKISKEVSGVETPEDVYPQAAFGHLVGSYDARYYGYLWSKVLAQDMFTRFEAEGVLNPKTGRDYRTKILEKGKVADPRKLVEDFLGRPINDEAFLRSIFKP